MRKYNFAIFFACITLLPYVALTGQDWEKTVLEKTIAIHDSIQGRMHISPGNWRPLFGTEQIAWVSPPWSSREYIWLDFPEAIFSGSELLFLSHINPVIPLKFPYVKSVKWEETDKGIKFKQELPNGISFGGSVTKKNENSIGLELWILNGSNEPLRDIKLQTCAYLHGIEEFDQKTSENKLVHVPGHGWIPFTKARELDNVKGLYHVGWREGPEVVDLPVILALSKEPGRLVAFTWFENTYSFIGNKNHPCFHADPRIDDIEPGGSKTIRGEMIFFKGTPEEFEEYFRSIY